MGDVQDLWSPAYVGEDRIGITVAEESFLAENLVVNRPVSFILDYSECEPEGVTLPMMITVQPQFGDGSEYARQVYTRTRPDYFTFTPRSAGTYLILVRERFHNLWQGRKNVIVVGDPYSDVVVSARLP